MFGDTLKAETRLPTPLFVSLRHQDMKGILEFIILIAVLIVARSTYIAIKSGVIKHKYASVIAVFKEYGYTYYSTWKSKGKGIIYRKQLDKTTIDSLLLRYKYEPLDLEPQYRIFDYVAIVQFPEWEERCCSIVARHGGVRLVHFYSLEVAIGGKFYQRPLSYYIDDDMRGDSLGYFELKNKEIISSLLFSDIRFVVKRFIEDEIKHWQHRNITN